MRALIFLFVISAVFAAWQSFALLALTTSVVLLALIYGIAIAFSVNELKLVAKEELYQIIATALIIALLMGSDGLLNAISTNADLLVEGTTTVQGSALAILSNYAERLENALERIKELDLEAGIAGSTTRSCYGASSTAYLTFRDCGGFSMYNPAFSVAGGVVGAALGVIYSIKNLIRLGVGFGFTILLPVGIILRTFKFTRGAGGLVIAFGIALYLIIPLAVLFGDMLVKEFEENSSTYSTEPSSVSVEFDCGGFDLKDLYRTPTMAANRAASQVDGLRQLLRAYTKDVLMRGILVPAIALLSFASSLSALAALGGAEINVSALARFI